MVLEARHVYKARVSKRRGSCSSAVAARAIQLNARLHGTCPLNHAKLLQAASGIHLAVRYGCDNVTLTHEPVLLAAARRGRQRTRED